MCGWPAGRLSAQPGGVLARNGGSSQQLVWGSDGASPYRTGGVLPVSFAGDVAPASLVSRRGSDRPSIALSFAGAPSFQWYAALRAV
jgi:hypothetical protein